MNKYLIFVKHSLPQIIEGVPAREWHLSEEGKLRAEHLAQRLGAYQLEVIVSSFEPKAVETAQTISKVLKLESTFAENLHEHDRSETRYLSSAEFQNAVREFFSKPDELVFGNETAHAAHNRFSEAVYSLLDTHSNKQIAIVSHGTVISLFVSRMTGTSDYSLWQKLGLPGFVVLDINSKTLVMQENFS